MEQNTYNFSVDGNYIRVSGILDGEGANKLVQNINKDNIFTLDLLEVSEIKFAALRSLLRCRQSGMRFNVINASTEVAERFEDSGVATFINVSRKPKPLVLGSYDEFGAGFLSKAFNNEDGDSMIKVYGKRVPKWLVNQEKTIAKAVMVFGIPTPLVGSLYEDGENTGLDFERIPGKRSFSRIISEQPERMEEMTVKFAKMCKQLHTTQCDTNIFSDRSLFYKMAIEQCKDITDEEKQKALDFLNSVPKETTCLHGDMQLSNVITNEVDDLWIDLSDFGYGNPMFDMGMWYFLSVLNNEQRSQDIFHLSINDMRKIWKIFAKEYFDADTEEKQEEVVQKVEPFAALHMLYLGSTYGFEPGMIDFVRAKIL